MRRITAGADSRPLTGQRLSLRSALARSAELVDILMGEVVEEANPVSGRPMLRRLDVRTPERMWERVRFEAVESERVPSAYYIPADLRSAVEALQAHGIRVDRLEAPVRAELEEFEVASTSLAARAFENHRERTIEGEYVAVERTLPAGTWRVTMQQPLARLAFYLLEPRSNDGLLTWNVLDDVIESATRYPIVRTRN